MKKYFSNRGVKAECVGPGPPVLISEKNGRSKLCKDTLGRLLTASQPEVLIWGKQKTSRECKLGSREYLGFFYLQVGVRRAVWEILRKQET